MDPAPTLAAFDGTVGDTFHVEASDGARAEFTLVEAKNRGANQPPPEGFPMPFSLLFDAPEDVAWGQGIMHFEHERVGRQAWFCAPVAMPQPGKPPTRFYEVIFA